MLKLEMNGRKMKNWFGLIATFQKESALFRIGCFGELCEILQFVEFKMYGFEVFMLNSFEEIRKGEFCWEFLINET